MDANHAMRELCSILGVGDFMTAPTIEVCVAAVRRLSDERSEAHVLLDEACVAKHEPLPIRVGMLRDLVRRAQDGWAQANSRLDQSNAELVAARGDLRVARERWEMLEKKLSGQQSNVDEAQRRAKAEIEDSKLAWEVLCSHGASNVRGLVPLHEAVKSVFGRLVKERDAANEELSETRQALGGFMGPDYRISEEVKKVVAIRDMLAARANEAEQKMMLAVSDLGAMTAERDTLAARVKELAPYPSHLPERPTLGLFAEGIQVAVSGTAVNPSKPGLQPLKCPCGGKIEFGRERVGHCLTCGASCRAMDPPPAIPDPDVREMPFERVTMAPPDTCGQSLTAALVEANLYKKLWRERAQKCQQALRRIRALTGDMSFALDEDWGADDDS